jgi:hypothetical protein
MKDVIQPAGLTTIATGLCSTGMGFATDDFNHENIPYNCHQRKYPQFLGTSSGNTIINVFDVDSQSNITVGGTSTDTASGLVSAANNPFVALL